MASEFDPEPTIDIRMPDLDGFELMARLKARCQPEFTRRRLLRDAMTIVGACAGRCPVRAR